VTRGRRVRTTVADPAASRAPDLVRRQFKASRPGQLHVADFTYVPLVTRRGPAVAEARAWFGRLGLDGLGSRRSGELSGGQAQRVALARGLVTGPQVLFADELTGSLDSVSGELVMSPMTGAAREQGTTVILVTHDARVAAYADREVVVRDGTVGSLTGATPSPGPAR
jgi:ABC-type lipoprotein export system ATPase subunit